MFHYLKMAALLLLTALCAQLNAQTASTDEKAVFALLETDIAAFAARDIDRFIAVYAEDADFISPQGNLLHGREAIRQAHVALFTMMPKVEKNSGEYLDRKARFLTADHALVTAHWKSTQTMAGVSRTQEITFSMAVRRTNGQWLIELFTLTPAGQ
ncbi:MAG: SgcJ/EcaC family oxidoreductase [Saprospiraceae bacterium]